MTINFVTEAMEGGDTVVFDYQAEPQDGDIVLVEIDLAYHRIRQYRRMRFSGDDVVFESDTEAPVVKSKHYKDIEWRIIGKVVEIRKGHPERIEP